MTKPFHQRAWAWIKAKWHYLAIACGVVLAVVFGVKTLRERHEERLDEKSRKAVERAREQLTKQREARAELEGRIDVRQEEIDIVNAHIATTRREIVQVYENTEGMEDDEVLARFKSLGYD
jgi:septal ring factor EnvC (AmiA/AmiB activator)